MDDDSTFTHHEACPSCNSSDALAMYTDGHGHCFSCSHYQHADDSAPTPKEPTMKSPVRLLEGLSVDRLAKRGITLETCKKFGYSTGSMTHPDTQQPAPCQVAQYHDERGQVVAQKIRFMTSNLLNISDTKGYRSHIFGHLHQIRAECLNICIHCHYYDLCISFFQAVRSCVSLHVS